MNQSNLLPRVKKWGKFILGVPLTIISLLFVFRVLYTSASESAFQFTHIDIGQFAFGVFCLFFYFLLRGLAWCKVLRAVGHHVPWTQGAFLLSISELRRYIPGNIVAVASRVSAFEKFGITKRLLLASQVVELSLVLIASAVLALPGVLFLGDHILQVSILSGLSQSAVYTLFAVLFVMLCATAVGTLFYIRRQLASFSGVSTPVTIDAFFVALLAWLFFGLGNFFVVLSLFPVWLSDVMAISSFFVLAWLIGFLSFVTPSGLGVREAVITVALAPYLGPGGAALAAVVTRVVLVGAEMLALLFTYVVKRDHNSRFFAFPWQKTVLAVSVVSYIFYFTYVSFLKHSNYLTGRFDLGNMDQTVWNTLNGRIFLLTDPNGTGVMSRLGVHSDFLLIFLAPTYLVWQDPRMLLLIQTVVIALGAVFVYLLANSELKNKTLGLVFGLSYLLNFWVQRQNVFDFHAVALGTTFLLGAFYFLTKKRYAFFALFIVLSVLTKENVFLVTFFFGIYIFLKLNKKIGVLMCALSLVVFYLLVSHFIPAYRPQGHEHFGLTYFAALGDSPSEIIVSGILRPDIVFRLIHDNGGLFYLFQTMLPTGFLSLLSPLYLLFAAGDYLINLISDNPWLRTIFFHYGALIIPFVYISSIYGAKRLVRWKLPIVSREQFLIYYILFFGFLSCWMYGVVPGTRWQSVGVFTSPLPYAQDIDRVISLVPEELSVTATNNVAGHMSYREKIYVIPQGMESDVVIFLQREPFSATTQEKQQELLEEMLSDYAYVLVYSRDELYVFAKNEYAPYFKALAPGN